jgi:hypothetical protein
MRADSGAQRHIGSDLRTRVARTAARSSARRHPIEPAADPDQRGDGQPHGAETVGHRGAPERTQRLSAHRIDVLPLCRRTRIGSMALIRPDSHICSDRVRARGRAGAGAAAVSIMIRDTGVPADRAGLLAEGHAFSPPSRLTPWGGEHRRRVGCQRRESCTCGGGKLPPAFHFSPWTSPRAPLETQGKPAGILDWPGDAIATGTRRSWARPLSTEPSTVRLPSQLLALPARAPPASDSLLLRVPTAPAQPHRLITQPPRIIVQTAALSSQACHFTAQRFGRAVGPISHRLSHALLTQAIPAHTPKLSQVSPRKHT